MTAQSPAAQKKKDNRLVALTVVGVFAALAGTYYGTQNLKAAVPVVPDQMPPTMPTSFSFTNTQ
jgi:hypothetical protein